jgi:hypothetical protein
MTWRTPAVLSATVIAVNLLIALWERRFNPAPAAVVLAGIWASYEILTDFLRDFFDGLEGLPDSKELGAFVFISFAVVVPVGIILLLLPPVAKWLGKWRDLAIFMAAALFPLALPVFIRGPIFALSRLLWWVSTHPKGPWAGLIAALTLGLGIFRLLM